MGERNYSSMHSENRPHMEESGGRENNPRYLKYTDRMGWTEGDFEIFPPAGVEPRFVAVSPTA